MQPPPEYNRTSSQQNQQPEYIPPQPQQQQTEYIPPQPQRQQIPAQQQQQMEYIPPQPQQQQQAEYIPTQQQQMEYIPPQPQQTQKQAEYIPTQPQQAEFIPSQQAEYLAEYQRQQAEYLASQTQQAEYIQPGEYISAQSPQTERRAGKPMMYRLPTGQTFQVYSYDTIHPLAAPKVEPSQAQDPQTVQEVLQGSGFTDSDTGKEESGEGKPGRKKTKGRRTTNLGPRLQVIGVVLASEITAEEGEEASAPVDGELKVECQMDTPRQKTVTFEFKTSDMVPEDIANTFIKENLLAKIHKQILVEQLYEIVKQLKENPDKVPVVTFPPEETLKREKSVDARKEKQDEATVGSNDVSPQTSVKSGPSSPARRLQSVQRDDKEVKMSRFLISPVVEQKAPPSEEDSASATGSDVQVSSAVSTPLNLTPESTMSHISMLGGPPINRLDRPVNLPTEDLMDGGDMSVSD